MSEIEVTIRIPAPPDGGCMTGIVTQNAAGRLETRNNEQ
jgi:hypothetical protein